MSQRSMQHRAIFGIIDALGGKHTVALFLNARDVCQGQQFIAHAVGDGCLGIVDQQIIATDRELGEPVGMDCKQVFNSDGMMALAGMGQSLPMFLHLMSWHERVSCKRD